MNDPLVLNYQASDLRIAAEFFTNWLPFLTRDLCNDCKQTLTDRVRSLAPEVPVDAEPCSENAGSDGVADPSLNEAESHDIHDAGSDGVTDPSHKEAESQDIHDAVSDGVTDPSLKEAESQDIHDAGSDGVTDTSHKEAESQGIHDSYDTNSLGSWKDGANEWPEDVANICEPSSPAVRMSWADMAQEDELEEIAEREVEGKGEGPMEDKQTCTDECDDAGGGMEDTKGKKPSVLPRKQREYIRFMNVRRKKDFICLERVNGKIVNILDGLELHSGVFSAAEQKRIVEFVYELQEQGRKGQLKGRTYSEPAKWMRGKGRVTIQFGCCYNYAVDKYGNPPGILRNEDVDPTPHLFKVIIRRLVGWHVLPPTCVPDSCIVNIYEEGDCIPPHIDNHDFVRPFCTVSFLSECNILFGSNLKIVGPGEFSGSTAIPLPVGSVLILNGNGADVAKHCVPSVPSKRISITFRKMDVNKWPVNFVPEPDLQNLQPLPYGVEKLKKQRSKPKQNSSRHGVTEGYSERENQSQGRGRGRGRGGGSHSGHRRNPQSRYQPSNRPRVRIEMP